MSKSRKSKINYNTDITYNHVQIMFINIVPKGVNGWIVGVD